MNRSRSEEGLGFRPALAYQAPAAHPPPQPPLSFACVLSRGKEGQGDGMPPVIAVAAENSMTTCVWC